MHLRGAGHVPFTLFLLLAVDDDNTATVDVDVGHGRLGRRGRDAEKGDWEPGGKFGDWPRARKRLRLLRLLVVLAVVQLLLRLLLVVVLLAVVVLVVLIDQHPLDRVALDREVDVLEHVLGEVLAVVQLGEILDKLLGERRRDLKGPFF